MSAQLTDEVFEDVLRAVLRENRPFAAPPSALRERVERIPQESPGVPRAALARNWLNKAAGAAAMIALVGAVGLAVALGALSTSAPGVGSPTPVPTTVGFDPAVDGPGIVGDPGDTVPGAPWLVAGSFGAALVLVGFRRSRRLGLAAVVVAVVALNAAHFVSNQRGLEFGFGWGPGTGIQVESAPAATNGPDAFYVVAEPGEIFFVAFNVTNESTFPVRVLGVIDDREGEVWAPRWTAVGMHPPDRSGYFPGIEDAQAFAPVEVQPGEHLGLFLVGRASACASANVSDIADGAYIGAPPIRMVFNLLGLTGISAIETPFVVAEPQDGGCDAFPLERLSSGRSERGGELRRVDHATDIDRVLADPRFLELPRV